MPQQTLSSICKRCDGTEECEKLRLSVGDPKGAQPLVDGSKSRGDSRKAH